MRFFLDPHGEERGNAARVSNQANMGHHDLANRNFTLGLPAGLPKVP